MQHILALSVIILHHVDSYSCRTVAKQLHLPLDPDTDVTESFEVKEREREISSILKQFLARSSELNSSEQLQKTLAKLTIEPYQGKNITKTKDPLHHEKQDTIAPLAIIVTSLQELNRLKNRNKNNDKKIKGSEDETVKYDPEQAATTHPEEMSSTNLNTDVRTNKGSSSTEDVDADDVSIERHEDVHVNPHHDDFSVESDVTNLSKDSPDIDVAWLSTEELIADTSGDGDASNEKIKSESLQRSNDKNTQFDFNTFTEPVDVEVEENQPVDAELDASRENLINLPLKDSGYLKLPEEYANSAPDSAPSLTGHSDINLKANDDVGENHLVALEPLSEEVNRDTCKKKHNHNPRNTYHLSFLFNR